MNTFDNLINEWITPTSIGAGIGTVLLSFFTGKLAPKLPKRFYSLLDNTLVRIITTAYLLNQQIHQPSMSIFVSIVIVLGFEILMKIFAPDTPSLSELVKSTTSEGSTVSAKPPVCNCYCGSTIHTSSRSKDDMYGFHEYNHKNA